jgi:hypothetical protein
VNAGQAAMEMNAQTSAAFNAMVDNMAAVASEKAKLEFKEWISTLTAEEAAITAQNEALDRNRELLEAAEAAKARLSAAKAGQEMAAIDADTSLSAEEKIRQKAAVRERLERETVESAVNKESRRVAAAQQDAEKKKAEASRLAADAEEVALRKEEVDAALKQAERREAKRKQALQELPRAERDLDVADKKQAAFGAAADASSLLLPDAATGFAAKKEAEAAAEAEAMRRRVNQLQNSAYADPQNAVNAEVLRKEKAAIDAAAAKAKAAADKAAADAEKLRLDAEAKSREFDVYKQSATDTYGVERGTREIQTNAAASAARQRADRERQEGERQRLRAELESREGGLDRNARVASGKFAAAGGQVGGELGSTLQGISKSLSDGTNQKEIQALADEFKAVTQGMGGATIGALRQMLDIQQGQTKEIEALKSQIKDLRNK